MLVEVLVDEGVEWNVGDECDGYFVEYCCDCVGGFVFWYECGCDD